MRNVCFLIVIGIFAGTLAFAQGDSVSSVIPKELVNGRLETPASLTGRFLIEILDTANVVDSHAVLPLTDSIVIISTDDQASWTAFDLELLADSTYYYDYTTPVSGESFHYYFQCATDSTFSSQSPVNSSEIFTPPGNLMANIHDDPAGDHAPVDVGGTEYQWDNTDLLNFKLGYSESKIFTQMTTNGGYATSHDGIYLRTCGSWPLEWDQTVDVYHLYSVPIVNPEAPYNDSIYYAAIYGDMDITFLGIGVVITPGVYKVIDPGDSAGIIDYLDAYTKISGPSTFGYNITGNVLDMWFTISLLTSDPDFGPLPADNLIYTGCGIASAFTMQSSCSEVLADTFVYVLNDFSKNTGFYLTTLSGVVLDIAENAAAKPTSIFIDVYPNPFNSSCAITAPAGAEIEIYDLRGNVVGSAGSPTGHHGHRACRDVEMTDTRTFIWRPDESISSGIYFLKATTEEQTIQRKIVLLK